MMNDALKNLIRTHYLELQGYVSAGMEAGKCDDIIYLNANENPYELPGLEGFNRYPEPQPEPLREAYAAAYGVKPAQIAMTRGADEAIAVLIRLFCDPDKDALLITPPTFGIYGVYGTALPARTIEVPLIKDNGTFSLDEAGIIARASEDDVKLVFLCSPNNPTGTSFDREGMIRICKALEGQAAVIVDETYAEFATQDSLTSALENLPNLIILRTLSKSYALAGMRMGTLLCGDTDFIDLIRTKALEAYPLPRASIEAASKALEQKELAFENIKKLLTERERMEQALSASPLIHHIYPSDANFLLVEMDKAATFCAFCAEKNVILRDFSAKPATQNCVRISIGTAEQNDLVLELLKDFSHA